jgi:hypothetical protein
MRRDYNEIHKKGRGEEEWKEGGAEEVKEYRRKSMDPAEILKGDHVFYCC